MLIAFQPAREYSGLTGTVIEVAPSDVTIRTVAGVVMEAALAYAVDGDGAWYVTTTDALYTTGTKYMLATLCSNPAATNVAIGGTTARTRSVVDRAL